MALVLGGDAAITTTSLYFTFIYPPLPPNTNQFPPLPQSPVIASCDQDYSYIQCLSTSLIFVLFNQWMCNFVSLSENSWKHIPFTC